MNSSAQGLTRLLSAEGRRKWHLQYRLLWQRIFIIIGVLLFSAAVAYVVPVRFRLYIVAAPFAAWGALILLRWPPLGFILLILGSVTMWVTVPVVDLPATLILVLVALWVLKMVVNEREITFIASATTIPLVFFSIVVVLAFAVGQFPWFPLSQAPMNAQVASLTVFLASFCTFFLVAHQVQDIRWLKGIVYTFLAFAILFAILALLPNGGQYIRSIFSTKVTGGSLFWTWAVALSLSQALFNRKLGLPWRLLLGFMAASMLYIGFFQGRHWASGWIPGVAAVVVILVVGKPRLALPVSVVALAMLASSYDQVYEALLLGDNEYSTVTRLSAWNIVGEIIKVSPVFGLGPANYYFYTPLFSILGWYVNFNSHNNYVDIVAQTGFLGLFCFFWFAWTIARLGLRLRAAVPEGGFARAYIYGCLGGLAGSLVAGMLGDWVLPFIYNVGIGGLRASLLAWLLWGGLVAIGQMVAVAKPVD